MNLAGSEAPRHNIRHNLHRLGRTTARKAQP